MPLPRLLLYAAFAAACRTNAPVPSTAAPSAAAARPTTGPPVAPTTVPRFDPALDASPWPRAAAEDQHLDGQAIDAMILEAEASGSDALLVVVDGKTVVERYFGRPRAPIETMSVTKSVVSLAIGQLITDARIASIDAPLSTWFPTWRKGKRRKVTLRHILTHVSGIEHRQGAALLDSHADRVKFVLGLDVIDEPGVVFSYNNEAVQLLAAIVEKAASMPLDQYVEQHFFAPLGITQWSWEKDASGQTQAYYGLSLTARDLAKIGHLMLNGGSYDGRQIAPADWVAQSIVEQVPGSGCGLLWWLRRTTPSVAMRTRHMDALLRHGLHESPALRQLVDRNFAAPAELWMALVTAADADDRARLSLLAAGGLRPFEEQPPVPLGFAADGWLGQQLLVVPSAKIVVVRQHRAPTDVEADGSYNIAHGFFGMPRWIERAIRPRTP